MLFLGEGFHDAVVNGALCNDVLHNQHRRFPGNKEYADEVTRLEQFFRSGWYGMLTDLDGEYLIAGVRRMVRQEVAA